MKWFQHLPQELGEYIFVKYWDCRCCIQLIGYVWVTKPFERDLKSPFSFKYDNLVGEELEMHFEGLNKDELPIHDGKVYVDAWCEYSSPHNVNVDIDKC